MDDQLSLVVLSSAEKRVLDVLYKRKAATDDIPAIARNCGISEFQTSVTLELLAYKKLIPQAADQSQSLSASG